MCNTGYYKPKATTPPITTPPAVVESKLDMGDWLNNVSISAYATDILQIPGQKDKMLKALEGTQSKSHDMAKNSSSK